MSALSLLSGVKLKSGLRAVRSVVGPKADIGFAGEVQPRRTFNHPPTQEILSLLLAVKPRPQEPVSPNLHYHLCPLVHYQHRHASVG